MIQDNYIRKFVFKKQEIIRHNNYDCQSQVNVIEKKIRNTEYTISILWTKDFLESYQQFYKITINSN